MGAAAQTTGRLCWEETTGAGGNVLLASACWVSSPLIQQRHSFVLQTASSPAFGHAGLKKSAVPSLSQTHFGPGNTTTIIIALSQLCQRQGRPSHSAGRAVPSCSWESVPPQCSLAFRQHGTAGDRTASDPRRQRLPLDTRPDQAQTLFAFLCKMLPCHLTCVVLLCLFKVTFMSEIHEPNTLH